MFGFICVVVVVVCLGVDDADAVDVVRVFVLDGFVFVARDLFFVGGM